MNQIYTRKLTGYAFDPSLSLELDTVDINSINYEVPWEELEPGPIGEYIEVVDYDPTLKQLYDPLDLNGTFELINDGVAPSESNPKFHQQMVYAVAMVTIRNFETALGRKLIWATRLLERPGQYEEYVPRLRMYPHALRDANAYYSPSKKAVLFGYFLASPNNTAAQMPGSLVFTCLSHDIIAHEVTHAILDGLHHEYNQPTNPDVLAFHEAFADIIALFQHFTFPDVLKHQIRKTRGNLEEQNILGELAQQFGVSIGRYGSLRDALGFRDEDGWHSHSADPADYQTVMEPHRRGSILVAAVFDAFLTIYKRRIQDLLRIATAGSGILPEGELHPDLVDRLASEAAKSSQHVLNMCIRAIDYCPPIDVTFGDYLRAVITADSDLADNDDKYHYRLAFIDAFRRRGIYPQNIKTLSEESLQYQTPINFDLNTKRDIRVLMDFLREYRQRLLYETDRKKIYDLTKTYIRGNGNIEGLHRRLRSKLKKTYEFEKLTGIIFNWDKFKFDSSIESKHPSFEVQNLRVVSRVGPDGKKINQIVFGLVQQMGIVVKNGKFDRYYDIRYEERPVGGFEVRGGSTLIFDLDSEDVRLRYSIAKPLFESRVSDVQTRSPSQRVLNQYRFQTEVLPMSLSEVNMYFGVPQDNKFGHMFSIMHKC